MCTDNLTHWQGFEPTAFRSKCRDAGHHARGIQFLSEIKYVLQTQDYSVYILFRRVILKYFAMLCLFSVFIIS
jgi:hypothetical protein